MSSDFKHTVYIIKYKYSFIGGFVDLRQGDRAKNYITQYDKPPTDLNEMAGKSIFFIYQRSLHCNVDFAI